MDKIDQLVIKWERNENYDNISFEYVVLLNQQQMLIYSIQTRSKFRIIYNIDNGKVCRLIKSYGRKKENKLCTTTKVFFYFEFLLFFGVIGGNDYSVKFLISLSIGG